MSAWTHACCPACYERFEPGRYPAQMVGEHEPCCWCGADNHGIYYRADPATTPCRGEGGLHDDE